VLKLGILWQHRKETLPRCTTHMLNNASHDKLIALSVTPTIFVEWVKQLARVTGNKLGASG